MKLLILSASAILFLTSCGGGGGSANLSAGQFVSGINNIAPGFADDSFLVLDSDETFRSFEPGEDEWFVIYDDVRGEHKAVSLQYVRSLVPASEFTRKNDIAREFRAIEDDNIFFGDTEGDFFGDDYEVVDYNFFTDSYFGRNSGFEYEDEETTTDVALMAKEDEELKFIKKATALSFSYNVSLESSLSLVSLASKMENMMSRNHGELTVQDQEALTADIEKFTGVSVSEMISSVENTEKKEEMVKEIAKKIGTSSNNLEHRLLPELLGISL